jgi:hypothetical protein
MVKDKRTLYHKTLTLNDTDVHQIESNTTVLHFGLLYVDTQNLYIGDQTDQAFLVEADSPIDLAKAIPLVDVDLKTVYVKAAVSGAVVHIIGS